MKTVSELRSKHQRFIYKNYRWHLDGQTLTLEWHFRIEPGFDFYPTMQFRGVTKDLLATIDSHEMDTHVFSIGMSELLSYWKLTASPEIFIEAYPLSQEQMDWWHKLLINGMGEYFYVNQIDFTDPDFVNFGTIYVDADIGIQIPAVKQSIKPVNKPSVLIPLGGGKDSVASLELFRRHLPQDNLACLLINPTQAAKDIAAESGLKTITVRRELDSLMLMLNEAGYLNGHVPISALFAFTSVLAARLYGYDYIPVSNERSSNEGNVVYLGRNINHQYSKTFEFEQSFYNYIKAFYPENTPFYFSYLRPLYELQIAKIFASMKDYHAIFRSCNVGQKTNSWCGNCSKCLFAFIILYPFVSLSELTSYFGENLLDKPSLLPTALELVGAGEQKPFDCVGTHEESLAAFHLCWKKAQNDPNHKLLQEVYEQVLKKEDDLDIRAETILQAWNSEHQIPKEEWEAWIKEALK